jgi:hypothetical protein
MQQNSSYEDPETDTSVPPATGKRQRQSDTQLETDAEDSEDDNSEEDCGNLKKLDRWSSTRRNGRPQFAENEYLIPEWLAESIDKFAEPYDGISLDLCGNPDLSIQAKYSYGEQSDGCFIDAFQFDSWFIPKDTTETLETATKKVPFAYMNPPTKALNREQTRGACRSHLQPKFVEKVIDEIECGNIQHAMLLTPLDPNRKWQHQLLSKSLVCILRDRVKFQRSNKAMERAEMSQKQKIWDSDPCSRAIFWISHLEPSSEDKQRFCEIFSEYGFIPGFNMKTIL